MIHLEPFEYPIITNWDALDDGLKFKQCVKDRVVNSDDPLQQYVVSDDETEMVDLLAQFSPKQRKRIMKYVEYNHCSLLLTLAHEIVIKNMYHVYN